MTNSEFIEQFEKRFTHKYPLPVVMKCGIAYEVITTFYGYTQDGSGVFCAMKDKDDSVYMQLLRTTHGVNGGAKVYHLAGQKCTTHSLIAETASAVNIQF